MFLRVISLKIKSHTAQGTSFLPTRGFRMALTPPRKVVLS